MIKIKTAEGTLTDVAGIRIKTVDGNLAKIAEGYQVVSVNGEKRLMPVFLSKCKHNYVISDELSYGASCTEDGLNVYVCTKCNDSYSETGEGAWGHTYVNDVCQHCGDCLRHGEVVNYSVYNSQKHEITCDCCGGLIEYEDHYVDHYDVDGTTEVPVCICKFEFDPQVHEHSWGTDYLGVGTGVCTVCDASCDHPETDGNGYCTTCGYCVWA